MAMGDWNHVAGPHNYIVASGMSTKQMSLSFPLLSGGSLSGSFVEEEEFEGAEFEQEVAPATPDYSDEDCDHGFLVTDLDDEGNKYWCKICDQRFEYHPGKEPSDIVIVEPKDFVITSNLQATLQDFRDGGVTLKETLHATNFTLMELESIMEKAFPPKLIHAQQYDIGNMNAIERVVGEQPKRISCYKELDDILSNEHATLKDVQDIYGRFIDITDITHEEDMWTKMMIVKIAFVDGSVQRIEMPVKNWKA